MMADDLTDAQIADTIAAMDARWNGQPVRCQCPGDPHGGNGCRQPATVIAVRHLVHQCNGPESNDNGDVVELLCLQCAQDLWISAIGAAARLRAAAARVGGHPICCTCQSPMSRPSDIVRSVKRDDRGVR
ncbi:hypothetical protein [Mycolicibacterium fortuitum]|uniref:hypothetical protein n=1 Tax=Mycolicibacterium fortuitum TaxID=1766 RepID=UPI001CDD4116|nr:hypothetical protein [Mycolicibacterium fortuitum]